MLTRWTACAAVISFAVLSGTAMAGKGLQGAGTVTSEGAVVHVAQPFGCKKKLKHFYKCVNHRKRSCTRTTHANCKVTTSCYQVPFGPC